ncbi:hypothetical protein FCK90_08630 [Kocuria coralli]|uniref:Uncharacterized protein n=1 Tax=Kocuria coralli TaxID=1461025 RepID=A0A5J5KZP2_9MICC|nr:hypothetical protein [Kocuria coralli]KAA9394171.1 hypothetical protein FCK90_08630 [Kocuria coralli]
MSEDIANIDADIEALFAALELAGVVADRARRDAARLAKYVSNHAPRTRQEWEKRAQLRDADGNELGWLDTSQAKRISLEDASGGSDRGLNPTPAPAQEAAPAPDAQREKPAGELVEIQGQFFEVTQGKEQGTPEQVRPISVEEAQARIQAHRPDLNARLVGEQDPRLEITAQGKEAGTDTERIRAVKEPAQQSQQPEQVKETQQPAAMRDRAWMAGVVAMTDSWERPGADHDGVRIQRPEISRQDASVVLSPTGSKDTGVNVQLHRVDGTVHVRDQEGQQISSIGAGRLLGTTSERARQLISDAGDAMKAGATAFDARAPQQATAKTATGPVGATGAEHTVTGPGAWSPGPQQGPGQSAAEAFGGGAPRATGSTKRAEPVGAPDTAEVVASSRMAGASASR